MQPCVNCLRFGLCQILPRARQNTWECYEVNKAKGLVSIPASTRRESGTMQLKMTNGLEMQMPQGGGGRECMWGQCKGQAQSRQARRNREKERGRERVGHSASHTHTKNRSTHVKTSFGSAATMRLCTCGIRIPQVSTRCEAVGTTEIAAQ